MDFSDFSNIKHEIDGSHAVFQIVQYAPEKKHLWNSFVHKAKNANFQHLREYIEYHGERYTDHSLLFMKGNNVVGLFPANVKNNIFYSHNGITFGGLLINSHIKQKEVLQMFAALINYVRSRSFEAIVIRLQPHIYNRYFSEEISYALFKNNAVISARAISSVISLQKVLPYSKGRKWSLKKAIKHDITMVESTNYDAFMELEKTLLKNKYGAVPVHSANELQLLSSIYPDKIKLYTVNFKDEMIGGVIIFLMGNVAKCQYICSNYLCKELNALDYLLTELIKKFKHELQFFDFGHSTLKGGQYLETNLIQNKESYGARGVCYDTYTISLRDESLANRYLSENVR